MPCRILNSCGGWRLEELDVTIANIARAHHPVRHSTCRNQWPGPGQPGARKRSRSTRLGCSFDQRHQRNDHPLLEIFCTSPAVSESLRALQVIEAPMVRTTSMQCCAQVCNHRLQKNSEPYYMTVTTHSEVLPTGCRCRSQIALTRLCINADGTRLRYVDHWN